uniref:Uncharacterized protein n=1 Tax=Tanacetum cinerariifolium TaxID=118510 RepID=A0A699TZP9_TANCI|nr:hypothetical protein [Tanacetum cinerariifolium]
MFKKLVYQFEEVLVKEVLVKEVKEFEKIFNELDDGDSIANDVCAIVRTTNVRMPRDAEISSSCVMELSKGLELEAEIAKENKMLSESEK